MSDQQLDRSNLQKTRENLSGRQKVTVPIRFDANPGPDKAAQAEASAMASDQLEEEAKRNEHDRNEKFRDAVATGVLVLFWLVLVMFMIAAATWFWHIVLPPKAHFLDDGQVQRLGTLLFGGITSTFASSYAKSKLHLSPP